MNNKPKNHEQAINLKNYIRNVQDFPNPGVNFKDISPLLNDPKAFTYAISELAKHCQDFDVILAPDARGFLIGAPLALMTQTPLVMARKQGKLPGPVISQTYALEYSTSELEIVDGLIKPGDRVIIVDDVLATSGTVSALTKLVQSQGATVTKMLFFIQITGLLNKDNDLKDVEIVALMKY